MRVAALYDVHGNLPALEAVLTDVPADAVILVGGDVAAGPWPAETVERLRAAGARFIRGNADRELAAFEPRRGGAPPEVLEWVRAQLSEGELEFLIGLPERELLDVAGLGHVLFCHATPQNDVDVVTAETADERLREILAGVSEDVVVCGHTHMQYDRSVDGVRVVNAGSVGMPYEDAPGAYWALLGPDVELRRTEFELDLDAVRASGFPGEWPQASRREATEFFESLARG